MTKPTGNSSGRLSLAGYARILKIVVRGGATWRSVAKKTGARRLTVQRILNYWTDVGLIHVRAWDIPDGDVRSRCPIYKFGQGTNVPWPGGSPPHKTRVRADLTMFTAVVRALMAGPCLLIDVVDEAGISRSACTELMKLLHTTLRLVYIADYQERPKRGQGHPMYRWGPGKPDKEKRAPLSDKELSRLGSQRNAARRRTLKHHLHLTHFSPVPTARTVAPEPEFA